MASRTKILILGFVVFWFACLLCISLPAAENSLPQRQAGLSEIAIQTHKYTLDNGLTVLVSEIPSSSVVSAYGLVKTGSATEGKFLGAGLSHFLEHMLFKGTEKR